MGARIINEKVTESISIFECKNDSGGGIRVECTLSIHFLILWGSCLCTHSRSYIKCVLIQKSIMLFLLVSAPSIYGSKQAKRFVSTSFHSPSPTVLHQYKNFIRYKIYCSKLSINIMINCQDTNIYMNSYDRPSKSDVQWMISKKYVQSLQTVNMKFYKAN